MIDDETDQQFRDYAYRMQSQGMNMELYFQYTGETVESVKAQLRVGAERQVKTRLALEKISVLENIEASEEDVEQEYAKLAEMYKMEADDVKKHVLPADMKKDLAVRKAVDFIKANANIKTEEMTAEEFADKRKAQDLPEIDELVELDELDDSEEDAAE
jgi:trigger factor